MSWRRRGVRLYVIRANKTRGVPWYTRIPFVVIVDRTVSSGVTHPIQEERRKQLKRWTWKGFWGKGRGK